MAIGRRCPMGCATWPDQLLYKTCLHCGEPTQRVRGVDPMPVEDAVSALMHEQFEKFYERHCAARGVPVEGPLTDLPETPA